MSTDQRPHPTSGAAAAGDVAVMGAAEERDALLAALGWKTGPFGDALSRKVILDDSAGLRPEMVKARNAAADAQAARDDYRYILGEFVHGSRSGVLGRMWEALKGERKRRLAAEQAARTTTTEGGGWLSDDAFAEVVPPLIYWMESDDKDDAKACWRECVTALVRAGLVAASSDQPAA